MGFLDWLALDGQIIRSRRRFSRSLHQIKLGSLETHLKSRLSDLNCSRGQEIRDNLRDCIVC
ncbi:hypothetical protein HanRHA438_Chr04g0188201 [Helianthus annuus]|uniref:Uncharacterized protein n=1 Tax=Helianthus annuus TaxID=4232 RepID=A0A251V541_HELAN|nr:hypothetical protein HanXRQr2_Chr04g0178631 [Helianthus annuus]KAJ0589971.1 hypothetical protein HanIR_Chr04g0192251 [Helianthus annuus]KAJ0927909.1 hypothetical protein HanRHA438_Chr04g0188201 [Helianthus annuus]KAJ0932323.1 hypothetical protein HanPSC8_Chr04g0172341 [Helianthus annuus]